MESFDYQIHATGPTEVIMIRDAPLPVMTSLGSFPHSAASLGWIGFEHQGQLFRCDIHRQA